MNPTHHTPSGPVTVDHDAAFLGCLMRCDAHTARQLLAGMKPDDVTSPLASEVLAMAIHLATRGIAPEPAVLLAEARRTGRLDTVHKHQLLTNWLIDTYRAAPDPVAGPYLKTAVLDAAYRRALRHHALRILARVDHVEVSELDEIATIDDRTVDLEHRHRIALDADTVRTITPPGSDQPATGELSAPSEDLDRSQPPPRAKVSDSGATVSQRDSSCDDEQRGEAA